MEAIKELTRIDIVQWLLIGFIIIVGFTAAATAIGKFSEIIGRPVKWIKNKNKDHELLIKTTENLTELQKHHEEDKEQSILHDNMIKEDLSKFMEEIRNSIAETSKQVNQFAENRIHDRHQSFQIQKELTDSIKTVVENSEKREKQIDSLMLGTMELLGDKIDEKFSKYVELNGIPENEVSEFDGLYRAYAATGGNSTRKHKYEYVKNNLKVIPVKVNILNTEK